MPFASQKQRRFAYANPEKFGGEKGISEWESKTPSKIPEQVEKSVEQPKKIIKPESKPSALPQVTQKQWYNMSYNDKKKHLALKERQKKIESGEIPSMDSAIKNALSSVMLNPRFKKSDMSEQAKSWLEQQNANKAKKIPQADIETSKKDIHHDRFMQDWNSGQHDKNVDEMESMFGKSQKDGLDKSAIAKTPTYKLHYFMPKSSQGPESLHTVVATHNGKAVGEMSAEPIGDRHFSTNMVEVHPEHQGQGLASAMYRHLEGVTKRTALPDLEAMTPDGAGFWKRPHKERGFGPKDNEFDYKNLRLRGKQPVAGIG